MPPPSALYKQFERLVDDGFPSAELAKDIEVRIVPLYDFELSGAVQEWVRTRGMHSKIERDLNRGGRLADCLKKLERDWHNWRKVKTLRREADRADVKTKCLYLGLIFAAVCFVAMFIIVGTDELQRRHLPRIAMFVRETLLSAPEDNRQKQQQQQQQQRGRGGGGGDDGFASGKQDAGDDGGVGFLPKPPAGYVSWTTWVSKQLGLRDRVASLRSGGEKQMRRCTCGEYTHSGNTNRNDKDTAEAEREDAAVEAETPQQQQHQQQQQQAEQEDAQEQQQPPQQQPQQQDGGYTPPPTQPSAAGKRFISRAANVFRKATNTLTVEETRKEETAAAGGEGETGSGSGILQPAFLLEGSEDSYRAHVGWLADRFDPPLPVVELVWRDVADATRLGDFLYWNTGWGALRGVGGDGSGSAACCVVLSLPNAIAPIARVRNVTRNSAVPLLVEKLSSVASPLALDVQRNVGCRAIVVARADPTTPEIRGKMTYRRMRNLFASFIL